MGERIECGNDLHHSRQAANLVLKLIERDVTGNDGLVTHRVVEPSSSLLRSLHTSTSVLLIRLVLPTPHCEKVDFPTLTTTLQSPTVYDNDWKKRRTTRAPQPIKTGIKGPISNNITHCSNIVGGQSIKRHTTFNSIRKPELTK